MQTLEQPARQALDVVGETWRTTREVAVDLGVSNREALALLNDLLGAGKVCKRPRAKTRNGRHAEWRRA